MARNRRVPVPRAVSDLVPGPDDVIPSIEQDQQSSSTEKTVLTPRTTPSIATTEDGGSRSQNQYSQNSSTPRSGEGSADGINDDLRALRLSSSTSQSALPLDLDNLRAALPNEGTASRAQSPLLLPPGSAANGGGSPGPSGARRRRSSPMSERPHDVRDEEPPRDRFHEPEFQRGFSDAKALMSRLAGVLGSSTLHLEPDSTIKTLRDTASALANFRCPPTRTVGLVGDSGVGKSSLLNSLLDFRGLARTSNGGAACTCVVTEYRHHARPDFAIDVVLFEEEELREQLGEMVHAYRHNHFRSADMESNEDRKHWADRAKLAGDTFDAMFAGRSTTALLRSDSSDERVLGTLLDWAKELRPVDMETHTVIRSLEDCSDTLMRCTSEHEASRGPAVWPYIKKISVYLNAYILSKGLVLVDLPGLRDLNSARRNITERYLLNCDEIFVVCQIGRARTDEGVVSVFELARQARLSNVGIICTKSDDIKADEAQRDWEGTRVAAEIQELTDSVADAQREIDPMKERLDELEDFEDILAEEETEMADLYRRIGRKSAEIEMRQFDLQRFIIKTRNAKVESELHDLYRNRIQGGNLHVFCASNTLYWEKRDQRPRHKALPSLELSGILAIRRHCMALVSESQLRIATEYIRDDIPNLLGNLELWVQTGAGTADAEQKHAVREALNILEHGLQTKLIGHESPLSSLEGVLTDAFGEKMYERRRIREWTRGAISAGQVWAGWHHTTYAAFCRQYGTHCTGAAGYHCWNEEAMGTMVRDLTAPWNSLQPDLLLRINHALQFISAALDWAVSHLDNALEAVPDSIRPLRTALTSRKRLLDRALRSLCEDFEANISKLRTAALSGLRTSYFGRSMESSYRDANAESGSGSWSRKKAVINGALRREQLFTDLMRKFRDKFAELAALLQAGALKEVEEHLGVIKATLDIIRSDNVALESERDPEFRARVGEEVDEVKEAMERIQVATGGASAT